MKLILFDFDGVIVSTFQISYAILRKLGDGSLTEDAYRQYYEGHVFDRVPKSVGGSGERVTEETPFFKAYRPRLMERAPVPGIAECIHHIREDIPLAIISSTMDPLIESFLEKNNLRSAFKKVYGASVHKDKRVKMKQALADFHTDASEAMFITDTTGDIHDATEVGIRSIGVTWGYHPAPTLKKAKPFAIVNDTKELEQTLENLINK